jgi:hypothetical protein
MHTSLWKVKMDISLWKRKSGHKLVEKSKRTQVCRNMSVCIIILTLIVISMLIFMHIYMFNFRFASMPFFMFIFVSFLLLWHSLKWCQWLCFTFRDDFTFFSASVMRHLPSFLRFRFCDKSVILNFWDDFTPPSLLIRIFRSPLFQMKRDRLSICETPAGASCRVEKIAHKDGTGDLCLSASKIMAMSRARTTSGNHRPKLINSATYTALSSGIRAQITPILSL